MIVGMMMEGSGSTSALKNAKAAKMDHKFIHK
jgi:hypothetical protein